MLLFGPAPRELQAHCYRMLGSLQDAEDAVQESCSGHGGRRRDSRVGSVRTWLFRITTNRCLNLLRAARRRRKPVPAAPAPLRRPDRGAAGGCEPYPDQLLDGVPDALPAPTPRYEAREAISLAFVGALQRLPAAPARGAA